MPSLTERIKNGWNAFLNNEPKNRYNPDLGISSYSKPDRIRLSSSNERTIVTSVYSRIAIDVASIDIKHVRLDDNGRFKEEIKSGLNEALSLDANIDQTGRALRQDIVMSLFDEGCIAIVPTDLNKDPNDTESYDIFELRVGKILEWYPNKIKVRVYNENKGTKEDLILPKRLCAIVENPLYAVMNEPNSTVKRLTRKLNLLDYVDEQSGSGKLDMIIQLPYVIKTEARRQQAEQRRKDIELQLSGSKYGIAYTDGTEKITQLNRSVENNLLGQIEYLTSMLYSQLGLTAEIMNGTANEETMLNYYSRTIEPVLAAITDEMKRKFLTKTARTQGQSIMYFRDPFKLVSVDHIAEIGEKFTRNEIMSTNEVRGVIGMKPSEQPGADELRNKNLYPTADASTGVDPAAAPDATGQAAGETNPMDTTLSEIMDD